MKAKLLKPLLAALLLALTTVQSAQAQQANRISDKLEVSSGTTFKVGLIYYTVLNDSEVRVARSYEYENLPLTTLEIPETLVYNGTTYTVTQIESYAFSSWATATKKVILPSSLKWIGECAFKGMFSLKEIICHAVIPPLWETTNIGLRPFVFTDAKLYVPFGCKEAYENDMYWHIMTDIIEMDGSYYTLTLNSGGNVRAAQKVLSNVRYTYQFVPSSGQNLKAVYFNGRNVTSEVYDGIYTTPIITGNSTLDVIFE